MIFALHEIVCLSSRLSFRTFISSEVIELVPSLAEASVSIIIEGCLQAVVLGSVPCENYTTENRQKPGHLLLILGLFKTYDASICRCPSNFGVSLARLQPKIVDARWNPYRSFDGFNSCHSSLEYLLYIAWCILSQRYSRDQGLTRFWQD